MPLVLGLTGLAGSGKGAVADYLDREYDFERYTFSHVLREEAEKRDLLKGLSYEQRKQVLSKLGEELRRETGRWDIVAEKTIEKMRLDRFENAVVDGFRSTEEVKLFKENFQRYYLVAVETAEEVRFARRKARDPTVTLEAFRKRDEENIKIMGLGNVMKMADYKIFNSEQGLGNLYRKVDGILEDINFK